MKERNKKYKAEGAKRKLGSYDNCQNCGKPYSVKSGLQKYCPDCAPIITRENGNKAKREKAKKQYTTEAKRAEKDKRQKVCIVCGRTFRSNTPTVTCSPECAKEKLRRQQAISDAKRKK